MTSWGFCDYIFCMNAVGLLIVIIIDIFCHISLVRLLNENEMDAMAAHEKFRIDFSHFLQVRHSECLKKETMSFRPLNC